MLGLLVGVILATATTAVAAPDIVKLIVNGQEVQSDVPPQVIDGRTLVPARFLAEALGANVEWDSSNNSVVVTSAPTEVSTTDQTAPETNFKGGSNVDNYLYGRELIEILGTRYPDMIKENRTNISLGADGDLKFGDTTFNLVKNSEDKFDIQPLIDAGIL